MISYKELNYFNINKKVAECQNRFVHDPQPKVNKFKQHAVLCYDGEGTYEFDPCNDSSDAIPIMSKEGIKVQHTGCDNKVWVAGSWYPMCTMSLNPLEAAMELYLMMERMIDYGEE